MSVFTYSLLSQSNQIELQKINKRILFIVDVSGSMKEKWQGETKWEMASTTLANLIDSFEAVNKDFEIGIRLLGHQYDRKLSRCDDSKLEVAFSRELTYEKVSKNLKRFTPKGMTPLAYSLAQSETDFPQDNQSQNVIILITDGLENCHGNPCEVTQKLKDKNIFINPYIIGLGIDSLESKKLECIGTFIDAKNKQVFKEVIKSILSEVSIRTTLTVSFTKSDSSIYPFYVPYSLVDKRVGRDIKNYIFSSETKKSLDTININTQFQYHLKVHTNPSFLVENFEIIKGQHQHFSIPILSGKIEYQSPDKTKKNLFYIHNSNFENQHWHSGLSPLMKLEASQNQLDLVQNPNWSKTKINLIEDSKFLIPYFAKGTLVLKKEDKVLATIFNDQWEKILKLDNEILSTIELQTGNYIILFKSSNDHTDKTRIQTFRINESLQTQILLQ